MILPPRSFDATLLEGPSRAEIERDALVPFLVRQRWFGGKARHPRSARFVDWALFVSEPSPVWITLVEVTYADDGAEHYHVPLALVTDVRADEIAATQPDSVLVRAADEARALVADALLEDDVCRRLFRVVRHGGEVAARAGAVRALPIESGAAPDEPALDVVRLPGVHSNTAIALGGAYLLKVFRRVEFGINPDVEISRFLSRRGTVNVPALVGSLEYDRAGESATLALAQSLVPSHTSGWAQASAELSGFFERVRALGSPEGQAPDRLDALVGPYAGAVERLGRRTAELHVALASDSSDPAFAPERALASEVESWSRNMIRHLDDAIALLARQRHALEPRAADLADRLVERRDRLASRLASLGSRVGPLAKIRVHGDYHLGQVLVLHGDFVILDFEGEPARPLADRRARHPVLRDLAGMLRSFGYVAQCTRPPAAADPAEIAGVEAWAAAWESRVSAAFLRGYFGVAAAAALLPDDPERVQAGLDAFVIDKAAYELRYELNNRPDWAHVPLAGLLAGPRADVAAARADRQP
jgi:trehalose synthase-fused probable maltokinase